MASTILQPNGKATQIHKVPRYLESKMFILAMEGFVVSETKVIVYTVTLSYALYSYYVYLLALRANG